MLLDSNLIIYASRPQHPALRTLIAREIPSVSAISKVETLGYPDLTEEEKRFLEAFFEAAEVLSVSQSPSRGLFSFAKSAACRLGMRSLPEQP